MEPIEQSNSFRNANLFVDTSIRRSVRNQAPWLRFIALVVMMAIILGVMVKNVPLAVENPNLKSIAFKEDPTRVCSQNPYAGGLGDPLDMVAHRADSWLNNLNLTLNRAFLDKTLLAHNHARFFPFDKYMTVCKSLKCVGGPCKTDLSKMVCGVDQLAQVPGCVIYSIGGNNQWDFEMDLLTKTPCQIHTFDCTGSTSRFKKPDYDRIHFHHVCLGAEHEDSAPEDNCVGKSKCGETWTLLEMQQKLGHSRIDLLKVDIEGFEWPLLESWPVLEEKQKSSEVLLPMQLLMEIHHRTSVKALAGPDAQYKDWKFPWDLVNLQARLLRMGYVVVERDDNSVCPSCTELTFIRYRCPGSGVYAERASLQHDSRGL